jgi:hypothetical protein
MSVVTLDWPRIETETLTGSLAASRPENGREAVFRSVLEIYIAGYERHLAAMGVERERRERLVRRTFLARLARLWE